MQRNRGFVSSRVSSWTGVRPFQRGNIKAPLVVRSLIVGGGGGGGRRLGGGGGGGGIATQLDVLVSGEIYSVTVGSGGAGSTDDYLRGSVGVSSQFLISNAITAFGGGGGGSFGQGPTTSPGGSGGGGSDGETGIASTFGGLAGSQGQNGGNGGPGNNPYVAGGGGGFSQVGEASTSSKAGDGGAGYNGTDLFTTSFGQSGWFSGGGGGGWWGSGVPGPTRASIGGQGGGGFGTAAVGTNSQTAGPGSANTGGGGGGGGWTNSVGITGGNGGSGVVILRYSNEYTATIGSGLVADAPITVGFDTVVRITQGTGNVSWA
jgi:hypothetical protein